MFEKTEFWIGLAAGAVTGVLGYRLYEQYGDQLQKLVPPVCAAPLQVASGGTEPTLEELISQKERLEDLIAEKNLES